MITAVAHSALAGLLMAYSHDSLPWLSLLGIALITVLVHKKTAKEVLVLALVFSAVEGIAFWSFNIAHPFLFFVAWFMHLSFRVLFVLSLQLAYQKPRSMAWTASCFWVGLEFLRTRLGLNPAPLGDAFAHQLWFIQVADLGGTYLVSFILVFCGISIGQLYLTRRVRVLIPASIIMAMSIGYSIFRLAEKPSDQAKKAQIAVTQGSIPNWFYELAKNDREFGNMLTRSYTRSLHEQAKTDDLMVWAETALPWDPWRHSEFAPIRTSTTRPNLLVGLPRTDQQNVDFNSVWFFPRHADNSASGRNKAEHYDKRINVPVFETGLGRGKPATLLGEDNWKVAALICWESVFPYLFAHAEGADAMAVLTDPSAFGVSDIAKLHARKTVLRAIEHRRPAIHASQVGPSQLIDAQGRIQAELSEWKEGTIRATLWGSSWTSLYSRSGGAFAHLIAGLALALFILSMRQRDRK